MTMTEPQARGRDVGEFGELLCPLCPDGPLDDRRLTLIRTSWTELHVDAAPEEPNTDSWKVACVGGDHVLMTSQRDRDGNGGAEPFNLDALILLLATIVNGTVRPYVMPDVDED